jgi:DNA-binding NtrC family response regulator
MARVQLLIDDPASRLTLRAILEADGHQVVAEAADVVVTDDRATAVRRAKRQPCLVLAKASEVRQAVDAMRQGVFGYLFVPFQPGEATMMVRRAIQWHAAVSRGIAAAAPETEVTRIADAEARLIIETLRRCKNNQTEAARILGIGRNTLWRKLRKLGIGRSRPDKPRTR